MKAAICEKYGPPEVVQIREVPKPAPKDNELLIRVLATTVSAGDSRVRGLRVPAGFAFLMRLALGFGGPRQPVLGTELSGVVEAVGHSVTRFRPGDAVFAFTDMAMGCHAEYCCVAENATVEPKPENISFEEAAALCFGGTTALFFLQKAHIKPGETVLINGASGAVGSALVQLAKFMGAQVTAVCGGANAELVRSLGADAVINYAQNDFTQNGQTYDAIFDTVGNLSLARCKQSLKPGGRLALLVAGLGTMLAAPWQSLIGNKRVVVGTASGSIENVRLLATLAKEGKFRPVIGRVVDFEQIVEAHRYADGGHKLGNVVVRLPQ
ncbi:MAG: NAD(P)-dependent alcohol dehydrogenase [Campylobacterales bacterium]